MSRIRRVLVANRGEIAVRIIRTLRDLGIGSVAVYADQDLGSPHAAMADQAYALGGTSPARTYLDAGRILEAARRAGADAIHPGYGFLSERADFARAVRAAGLAWIGPSPQAIERLGDKISARRLAIRCGVQPVPGTERPATAREQVRAFARDHGFPLVAKRPDGGGGRGIVVMREAADVDRFWSEQGEGAGAFFLERFVEHARHVETQCARDAHGHFEVVTTRDCSLQRRRQKLIEEAPAPFVERPTERRLADWSRRLFEATDYVGLGTCEFLLEPGGSLYFLEVNPRLQVEHPVSEQVAGVDLVREQLRIAQGEELTPLPPARGHALEFRVTSEDPDADLAPTAGTVRALRFPQGPGVRIDSGVEPGQTVTPDFDSLLAKVVVTGQDRAQALARARRALAEFHIEGLATPVPLFREILERPEFTADSGRLGVDTTWLERTLLADRRAPAPGAAPAASSSTAGVEPPRRSTYVIEVDRRRVELTLPDSLVRPDAPDRRPTQPLRQERGGRGAAVDAAVRADGVIAAPMQAIVVRIGAAAGARVEEGEVLAVLESMKMENFVHAPYAATVADVLVAQGDTVARGAPLVRLTRDRVRAEPPGEPGRSGREEQP